MFYQPTDRKTRTNILAVSVVTFSLLLGCANPADHNDTENVPIPYQLRLERIDSPDFPGLHSMIYATYNGKLILMAGRLNGMHGFPGQNRATANPSFPPDTKNTKAFLIELATGKVLAQADVTKLPASVVQQLTATNTQFLTKDTSIGGNTVSTLFVVGGYGYQGRGMATLDQVMALPLPDLVKAIEGNEIDADFARNSVFVGNHPALAITGGDLELMNDNFLLIFGHKFHGVYSTGGGVAQQEYSSSVREFIFKGFFPGEENSSTGSLQVVSVGQLPFINPERPVEYTEEYHRRDLTIRPVLSPDGKARIAALGGVFKPGQMAGYVHPVYIWSAADKANFNLDVDTSTTQWMSQYKVATVPIYSALEKAMYTTFFAGISQYYWKDGKLQRDEPNFNVDPVIDGLPFINTISTLKVTNTGSAQYLHDGQLFPPRGTEPTCGGQTAPYLGAETLFVFADGVADEHGVIQLDTIEDRTVVGYLVGGIAAVAPYPNEMTCASPTYYRVTIEHGQTRTTRLSQ